MTKAEIGEAFMRFMEKEFNVTFVDVTPQRVKIGQIQIKPDATDICGCGHYLRNHTPTGCMTRCPCLVGVVLRTL